MTSFHFVILEVVKFAATSDATYGKGTTSNLTHFEAELQHIWVYVEPQV